MRPDPTATVTARPSLLRRAKRPLALAALAGAFGVAGCGSPPVEQRQPEPSRLVEPNSFKIDWRVSVDTTKHGPVDQLFLRDDSLFVYTEQKVVQRITAGGGRTQFITGVVRPNDVLYPPVILPASGRAGALERVLVFPTNGGFVNLSDEGRVVSQTRLNRGLTTAAVPTDDGNVVVGSADDFGGRLLKVDPLREFGAILDRVQVGAIASRPATGASGRVYVADLKGNVYGLTTELRQAWSPPFFDAEVDKGINADLKADDFGVYAAGTDGTLNVLSRDRGRLLWRYFAGRPLFASPVPTEEWVYQAVGGVGVVALPKFEGSRNSRQAAWTAPDAYGFLSHDDRRVYLLQRDGRIAAHDKRTGDKLFTSERNDFQRFARNTSGPTIYAATRDGEVVAIEPVLGRGEVGEVAMLTPRP